MHVYVHVYLHVHRLMIFVTSYLITMILIIKHSRFFIKLIKLRMAKWEYQLWFIEQWTLFVNRDTYWSMKFCQMNRLKCTKDDFYSRTDRIHRNNPSSNNNNLFIYSIFKEIYSRRYFSFWILLDSIYFIFQIHKLIEIIKRNKSNSLHK